MVDTTNRREDTLKLDEHGRRLDDVGKNLDDGKPVALAVSDHATFSLGDGSIHDSFITNRRVIILSMPKYVNMNAATTIARDLLEEIHEAMETEYPTQ